MKTTRIKDYANKGYTVFRLGFNMLLVFLILTVKFKHAEPVWTNGFVYGAAVVFLLITRPLLDAAAYVWRKLHPTTDYKQILAKNGGE